MKKFLFLIMICLVWNVSFSQGSFRHTALNPTGHADSTSVDTMYYSLSKSYQQLAIQPVYTRLTGTAAGKMYLAYSVNGLNYITSDSVTISNAASNTTIWNKITAAKYFRIITGGATVVTATVAAKISATD